jgi:TPR repeat protein
MNSPPDRGGASGDPLHQSPNWERNGEHAERPDVMRFALDATAQQIGDLHEENTGPSATLHAGEGPILEPRVLSLPAPDVLSPDILDLDPCILDPEILREPPRRARGKFGRFALGMSIAAVVVIAVLPIFRTISPGWTDVTGGPQAGSTTPQLTGQTQASTKPQSQATEQTNSSHPRLLVLRASPHSTDEAIPLGLSLAGASAGAALVLTGLPAGWTISSGLRQGADNWLLSTSEVSGAAIRPPLDFVGAIDLGVELRLADGTVTDRLSLRLTWVDAPTTTTVIAAPQNAAASAGTGSAGTAPPETTKPQARSAPLRHLDRDEIANLRKRGEEFMAAGNVGLARLDLQHAAEAGDAQAAFALATTYDPTILEARKMIGVVPDTAMARAWYENAKELGLTDAADAPTMIVAAQKAAVAIGTGNSGIAAPPETPNLQATSAPLRHLDRDEIANLRKRGEKFIAAGNLGLARLDLQHAAEAGDAQAAFALATTYDPILLQIRKVIGVVPDIAMARAWYEKAKELGSTDASLRLEVFANRDR